LFIGFDQCVIMQSNFATLDEDSGVVVSRRADRHFEEEGPILCAALDGMKLPSFPEYEVRVRLLNMFPFVFMVSDFEFLTKGSFWLIDMQRNIDVEWL